MQYAELIRELCDSDSEIVFEPLPQDDPTRRKPDIAKANSMLGWAPNVPLRDGLVQTIAWYREHL